MHGVALILIYSSYLWVQTYHNLRLDCVSLFCWNISNFEFIRG